MFSAVSPPPDQNADAGPVSRPLPLELPPATEEQIDDTAYAYLDDQLEWENLDLSPPLTVWQSS